MQSRVGADDGICPEISLQNQRRRALVLPVTDSAVDLCTARSRNTGSDYGNGPIFPGRRTNQSIG
jgi:hypothetical protein